LFCSNYLARFGRKTLLLEHYHQPGGLTGGFWRKKYYWDAGDQSFESAGIMLPLLKSLGLYHPADWEFATYSLAYK
jgi:phytoene dehydrogenase-like protein